jgi:aspartate aminotransferase
MKIGSWLNSIEPSPTMEVNEKAMSLREKGLNIISLVVGEPDFQTPEFVKKELQVALEKNMTKYSAAEGIEVLRKEIVKKLKNENNLDYKKEDIIVTCGAKQAIAMAICVLIDEGEDVIVPAPYWVSYPSMVKLARGNALILETKLENKYKVTIDDLKKIKTSKTRAILLNSPSNPSGVMYEKEELETIVNFCYENNIVIISDEVYEKIVFDKRHVSIASVSDKAKQITITVNGFSKSHCMTGWRIGYAAGPKEFMKAMKKYQSHFLSHIPTFIQYAASKAISKTDFIAPMVEKYKERINIALNLIKKHMPLSNVVIPNGAFYLFPDVSNYYGKSFNAKKITNSIDMANFLLEFAHVAIVPGIAFGMKNNIRISVATSKDIIKEGVVKIGKALELLK